MESSEENVAIYEIPAYPLEVECSGGDHWSKGWQSPEDFWDAVEHCCGERYNGMPHYEVWKFVPSDPYGDLKGYYWQSSLGTPGAFPVTVSS